MFGGFQKKKRMPEEIEQIGENRKPPAPPKTGSKFHSPLLTPNFAGSEVPEIEPEWLMTIKAEWAKRDLFVSGECKRCKKRINLFLPRKERVKPICCPFCGFGHEKVGYHQVKER